MSFELLNDANVEKTFKDLQSIASLLENVQLSRHAATSTVMSKLTSDFEGWQKRRSANSEADPLPTMLPLPVGSGEETIQLLSALGGALRTSLEDLQKRVDVHLTDFYKFMKGKHVIEVEEMCTKRKIVPEGFVMAQEMAGIASEDLPDNVEELGRRDAASLLPPVIKKRGFRKVEGLSGTRDAVNSSPGYSSGFSSTMRGGVSNSTTVTNAPLALKLKERREAAATLQSFIFFLLEGCLSQCEASCAGVFLNGLPYKDLKEKAPPEDSAVDLEGPPRFLHCVANLYGGDQFPTEISYATLNPLTAVVQTGVAVNLRNSSLNEDNVSRSLRKNVKKSLNISTGLIIPLDNFGCLVVANKKRTSILSEFTVSDEHVAWGGALFITNILTLYARDLLLENAWFPYHVHALRKFATFPKATSVEKTALNRPKRELSSELETILTSTFGGLAHHVLALLFAARQGSLPRRLTMVRTADPETGRVVPGELIPRNKNPSASAENVTEEEIFEGAAQYISNLESLWHKTLAETHVTHQLMQSYDRELEKKSGEILRLEGVLRKLNARIVLLERHKGGRSSIRE